MATIGFLGTGTMGMPMARNLLRAGFKLRAWNRTPARAEPLTEDGAQVFDAPDEAIYGADFMVTMLSDADVVTEVAGRALGEMGGDAIWVQMSTIGIGGAERCAELAESAGIGFVDAPVLGTRQPAEQAKLIVLASGSQDAVSKCQPLFDAVGHRTLMIGEAGSGSRCKVAINSWIVGVVGVLAETIALAEALEIDPRLFFDALEGGTLDLPYARIKGKEMIERSFEDPAFRLTLARKDAELVLEGAGLSALELPIMQATLERLRAAERQGHGDEDMAATYWASVPEAGAADRTGG
jgi:3-hydroxyisobutyrate dehydrogenase